MKIQISRRGKKNTKNVGKNAKNQWAKEEITKEFLKYLEENKNKTYQNL